MATPSPAPEALDPALEQAIQADPDDLAARTRYADWLVAHGNPRGALARCQLALLKEPRSKKLRAQEKEILGAHAAQIRGGFGGSYAGFLEDFCSVTYRGGFWHTVAFSGLSPVLAAVLAQPSARLLHTLSLSYLEAGASYDAGVGALCQTGPHAALRELRIGSLPEGQDELVDFAERTTGPLAGLAQACPRLQILRTLCPRFGAVSHPALRIFDARMGATADSLHALADSRLPALEELHLGVYAAEEDMYPQLRWEADALAGLLRGDATPALRRLVLWCLPADAETPWAARVRASPLGRRLTRIDVADWDEPGADAADVYEL